MLNDFMLQAHILHIEKQLEKADLRAQQLKVALDYYKANNSANNLKNLWDSSKNFWYRFYTTRPRLDTGHAVFVEEVREFLDEVNAIIDGTDEADTIQKMMEEGADVMVTMIMCMLGAGGTWEQLETAINNVCLKNDAKTHDTHAINPIDGKITRKSKLNGYISTELP